MILFLGFVIHLFALRANKWMLEKRAEACCSRLMGTYEANLNFQTVYKIFTSRVLLFITISPAFAIVLVRAGVLLQGTKVETPELPGAASIFIAFARHCTCSDSHDLVS
jgi:hypothetical protein